MMRLLDLLGHLEGFEHCVHSGLVDVPESKRMAVPNVVLQSSIGVHCGLDEKAGAEVKSI